MGLSKRVSLWTVEEVLDWVQEQYPTQMGTLHVAFIKHAISGTTNLLNVVWEGFCKRIMLIFDIDTESKQQLLAGCFGQTFSRPLI